MSGWVHCVLALKAGTLSARQGQGVVEYAGALVVAAALIGMVILNTPDMLYLFFTDVQESILNFLLDAIEAVG